MKKTLIEMLGKTIKKFKESRDSLHTYSQRRKEYKEIMSKSYKWDYDRALDNPGVIGAWSSRGAIYY